MGSAKVAADVGGEGLQGRDVKGVEAGGRGRPKLGQGGQEPGEGLAAAGGRDEEGGGVLALASISCWWGWRVQPLAANQSDRAGGSAVMGQEIGRCAGLGNPWRANACTNRAMTGATIFLRKIGLACGFPKGDP
jgi:hypothetical protein